jgi:hypothetical protein
MLNYVRDTGLKPENSAATALASLCREHTTVPFLLTTGRRPRSRHIDTVIAEAVLIGTASAKVIGNLL